MISYLTGTIHELDETSLILLVNGVGYEVIVPVGVLTQLRSGEQASFYIHHHIREDNQQLFGFLQKAERHLFRQMIHHVNGVGPKIAMAAMGAAPHQTLIRAIQLEDISVFKGVPGVGPKTAKRIVMDLKSTGAWDGFESIAPLTLSSIRSDVLQALEQLGYEGKETQELVADLDFETLTLEEALKLALQKIK